MAESILGLALLTVYAVVVVSFLAAFATKRLFIALSVTFIWLGAATIYHFWSGQ